MERDTLVLSENIMDSLLRFPDDECRSVGLCLCREVPWPGLPILGPAEQDLKMYAGNALCGDFIGQCTGHAAEAGRRVVGKAGCAHGPLIACGRAVRRPGFRYFAQWRWRSRGFHRARNALKDDARQKAEYEWRASYRPSA